MTDRTTFGATCAAALKEAKRANANLSWPEIAALIQKEYDSAHDLTLEAEDAKPRASKKDVQGALFDALVVACGLSTNEMTRPAKGAVGAALLEIKLVTPDVTPEEIMRRARQFKQKHRDWPLTPSSLCKYWGDCGRGDKTESAKRDIYQEPPNWREVLRSRGLPGWSADTIEQVIARQWVEIRTLYGRQILELVQ